MRNPQYVDRQRRQSQAYSSQIFTSSLSSTELGPLDHFGKTPLGGFIDQPGEVMPLAQTTLFLVNLQGILMWGEVAAENQLRCR